MAINIESKVVNSKTAEILNSKKVIMATKAANRIKDKWAEQGFEISESQPYVDSFDNNCYNWSMLLTRQYRIGQDIINIVYNFYSKPDISNFTISACYHLNDTDEVATFCWNEHLLNLLNEQINCIDDAICILEHSEEMLANG